jgi:hypothetical protein
MHTNNTTIPSDPDARALLFSQAEERFYAEQTARGLSPSWARKRAAEHRAALESAADEADRARQMTATAAQADAAEQAEIARVRQELAENRTALVESLREHAAAFAQAAEELHESAPFDVYMQTVSAVLREAGVGRLPVIDMIFRGAL